MSALQKIATGLLLTVAPLPIFAPAHPHPAWRVYYVLPNPLGWLLVIAGLRVLSGSGAATKVATGFATVALVVGVVLWFPEINHLLSPKYDPGVSKSWTWLASLPGWLCLMLLTHQLGKVAAERRDRNPEVVFGSLRVAFVMVIALPAIVYGAPFPKLEVTMALIIGLAQFGAIAAMFAYNKRSEYAAVPGKAETPAI